jgi:hypothetical protein
LRELCERRIWSVLSDRDLDIQMFDLPKLRLPELELEILRLRVFVLE